MTTTQYPFDVASNYTFDADKIEVSGGVAKLKLLEGQSNFTEDFADDTDFTYDADLAEFSSSTVRQKDQTPANATFVATYTDSIDGNYGDGTLSGTSVGTGSISGNRLDLSNSDNSYIYYDADANADSQQVGTIRFKLTPNYSGTPTDVQYFCSVVPSTGDTKNLIAIYQATVTGAIVAGIWDSTKTMIVTGNFGTWNPVIDQTYEIEFNYDITTGATRLFIDGVQKGSTFTNTGTRDADISQIRIGTGISVGSSKSNFYIEDLVIFNAVQHAANYTPGYSLSETLYATTNVTLPEMMHTGDGTLISFDIFSTSEAYSPRYTLQIGRSGNYLYWDGSGWQISDGTYSQATSAADFNTYATLLDIDGEVYVQFKVHFTQQNNQGYVDTLTATLTRNIGYSTDNPSITINSEIRATAIESIEHSVTIDGTDAIQYIFNVGGQDKYITGGSVTNSNGTYAQSSVIGDFNTYISSLVTSRKNVYAKIFLHSSDGSTTPEIDTLTILYNAAIPSPSPTTLVNLEGFIYDNDGPISSEVVYVRPFIGFINDTILHKYQWIVLATTDADGYFSGDIHKQPTSDDFWEIKVGSQRYKIQLPETSETDLGKLTYFKVIEAN